LGRPNRDRKRVLLVEDHENAWDIVAYNLEEHALFYARGFNEGRAALSQARILRPLHPFISVSLWWGGVPLKNKRISAEKIFLIKGGLW
jgi:hypothetical protein